MGVHYGKADFITYGKPSLFLDFANKKSLVDRISQNNLITFTRTSTATYVGADGLIKTASADEPRFDHSYDPVSGTVKSLGLLIEQSRTNLISYSQDFTNALWQTGINRATCDATTGIDDPSGGTTASRWSSGTSASQELIYRQTGTSAGVLTGQTCTKSIWIRRVSNNGTVSLFIGDNIGVSVTSQLDSVPVGTWVRCSITRTIVGNNGDTRNYIAVYPGTDGQPTTIDIWGDQVEVGSFPTSYIPTSGSTATRTPDNASITGSNFSSWYNPNQGTFFTNFRTELNITNNIWSVNNYPTNTFGTVLNYSRLLTLNNIIHTQYNVAGTNLYPTFSLSSNNYQKTVQSYDINSSPIISAVNGTLGTGPGNIYGTSPNFTQLEFGKNSDNRNIIGQYTISQLSYYPTRLSNNQLQNLTK